MLFFVVVWRQNYQVYSYCEMQKQTQALKKNKFTLKNYHDLEDQSTETGKQYIKKSLARKNAFKAELREIKEDTYKVALKRSSDRF